MRWAMLLIFGTIGLAALLGGVVMGLEAYTIYREYVPTRGTVVDVIEENTGASSKGIYVPVVEFTIGGNDKIRSRMRAGSEGSPAYERGDVVDVLYNRRNPVDARIGSVAQLWTGPLVTGSIGLILVMLSSALFVRIGRFDKGIKAIGSRN